MTFVFRASALCWRNTRDYLKYEIQNNKTKWTNGLQFIHRLHRLSAFLSVFQWKIFWAKTMSIAVIGQSKYYDIIFFCSARWLLFWTELWLFFLKFNVQAVAASPFNLAYVRVALIDFIFKSNDVHVLYIRCMTFLLAAVRIVFVCIINDRSVFFCFGQRWRNDSANGALRLWSNTLAFRVEINAARVISSDVPFLILI